MKWLGSVLGALLISAPPALAAEKLLFTYTPLQRSLAVSDIELFAKEGKITEQFANFTNSLKPEQLKAFRDVLNQRFSITPTTASQFMYSPIGEVVMKGLGEALRTGQNFNGDKALRAAIILSTVDPDGLTLVNVLKKYPIDAIRINIQQALQISGQVQGLTSLKSDLVDAIEAKAKTETAPTLPGNAKKLLEHGAFTWQKETIRFNNPVDTRYVQGEVITDLYMPKGGGRPVPLIVISHGIGSNRTSLAYLAEQFASWGFAVAAIEHPGSSTTRYAQFADGLVKPAAAEDFYSRPQEVSRLLDKLASYKALIDLNNVGVLGQSKGGFTALVLGGANLDLDLLQKNCLRYQDGSTSLNISLILQCQADRLQRPITRFYDPRIKAVFAINPIISSVIGSKGMSQLQVPVAILGGADDFIAPLVPEQIEPFSWLTAPNRYFILMHSGTHFSTLADVNTSQSPVSLPTELTGPDATAARPSLCALSTAFFMTHLAQNQTYKSTLSEEFAKTLDQTPFRFTLTNSLEDPKIQTLLGRVQEIAR
jgi:predicted dienelactone hydrolase